MRYLIEPRERRYVKGYGFMSFARNFSDKYSKSLTVCSCHVTYTFQSESTLYSCLNVKELLARSRREI